ncbi:hypothetical protein M8745_19940, partial [Lutimaribacter sp. EGI FJ00014]|nr:hypothetical protein [Lutimaribacter sp. EGI FJ00014]
RGTPGAETIGLRCRPLLAACEKNRTEEDESCSTMSYEQWSPHELTLSYDKVAVLYQPRERISTSSLVHFSPTFVAAYRPEQYR